MPFPYPEQYGVPASTETYQGMPLQLTEVVSRDLPPAALPSYTDNPQRDAALLAQTIAPQQVPGTGPVVRERVVANPYYTPAGSAALHAAGGPAPVMMQTHPYATAGWNYNRNPYPGMVLGNGLGSPQPLLGYPSAYPHVLNGALIDTAYPYLGWLGALMPALQTAWAQQGSTRPSTQAPTSKKSTDTPTRPALAPSHTSQGMQAPALAPALAPAHSPALASTHATDWTWDGVLGESPAPAGVDTALARWGVGQPTVISHHNPHNPLPAPAAPVESTPLLITPPEVQAPDMAAAHTTTPVESTPLLITPPEVQAPDMAAAHTTTTTPALETAVALATPAAQQAGALDEATMRYGVPMMRNAEDAMIQWLGVVPNGVRQQLEPVLGTTQYARLAATDTGRALLMELVRTPALLQRVQSDPTFIDRYLQTAPVMP